MNEADVSVLDSGEVVVPLPPHERAPGYRDSLSTLARMRVRDVADGWLAIAPREGVGATNEYFRLERLCDGATRLHDETWASLLAFPPLHVDEELVPNLEDAGRGWRERLREWADRFMTQFAPRHTSPRSGPRWRRSH